MAQALHHQRYAAVLEMLGDATRAELVRRAAASLAGMCALNLRLTSEINVAVPVDPVWARQRAAEDVLCARPASRPRVE